MKFLTRINYLRKFTYLFILSGISLSTLILFFLFIELSNYQKIINKDLAKYVHQEKKKTISKVYEQYKKFLVSLDENSFFIKYLNESNEENSENLAILFDTIIKNRPEVTQLRYIDELGNEKIRIERKINGGETFIVSEDKLQNKLNRDYFVETMKLKENMVYVSKIDLNIEHGKIELPIKPVWRFAVPIFYKNEKRGIFIVNIFAENFLNELINSKTFNITIYDQDGETLVTSFKNSPSWTRYLNLEPLIDEKDFVYKNELIDIKNKEKINIMLFEKNNPWNFLKFINEKLILLVLLILIVSFILAYYLAKIPKVLFDELESQQKFILQQSKLSTMGEMIAMIAHQWRQPLNGMSVLLQEVEIKKEMNVLESKDIDFAIINIKNILNYMSQTINDFRDFFKPTKAKTEFNLFDVINQSFKLSEVRLSDRGIDFKVIDISKSDIECFKLVSFESEIKQVFINLINNSIDAFGKKEIEKKEIIVNLKCGEKLISINFIDNAGGIDKQILENIFEPYSSTKEEQHGTGLGLYLSKMIIEKNIGGKISAENLKNGALFKIIIPK